MSTLRQRVGIMLAGLSLLVLASCGYRLYGQNLSIPEDVRDIAIPLFENNSPESRLDSIITEAFRLEVERFRDLSVVSEKRADAVLVGVINSFEQAPQLVSAEGIVQEYRLTFNITLRLIETDATEPLEELVNIPHTEFYRASADFESRLDEQEEAWRQAAERMAESMTNSLLSGF